MSDNYMPLQNNLHILKDMEGREIVGVNELGIYFEFVYSFMSRMQQFERF